MSIKKIYDKLIHIGTSTKNKKELNKRIKLANLFSLLWYIAFFLTSIITIVVRGINSSVLKVNIVGFVVITMCFLFNKTHKYLLAAFGILLHTIFYYVLLSCFIAPERFVEFFLVFVPCVSLLLFNNYKFSWIIFIISVIAFHIPFFIFKYYQGILFISPLMLFLFVVNFTIVLYFKKLNNQNEHLLALERDKVLSDKIILENQQQQLQELNEFKSHFFVNLSHEIRTPLTLIQGYASRVNLNNNKEKTQEQIDIITNQSIHIQSIIDNILDLSKMDAKKFRLNTSLVDLTYFLNKHFRNFKEQFDAKEIHFSLKNKTKNIGIDVDEDLFSKSINNLLSNALKFTSKKGQVILKAFVNNEKLILEVIDNGIGIEEKDIHKIFDRFYQSPNHITKSQGSGIGLSFTKSIIENHGFNISATSMPNIETSFSIQIPKEALQEVLLFNQYEIEKPSKTNKKIVNKKPLKSKVGKKILVVDDHDQMRNYISTILYDYQITVAENGKDALDKINEQEFDAIITDYMMPVMDGEELVNEIKNKKLKTPIIVITARTDNSGKLAMLRLGIDGYLIKPFQEEELLIHLEKSLKSHEVITHLDSKLDGKEKERLNKYAQVFNNKLRKFVENNLNSNSLSVEAIAEYFEISKSTLNRKVKFLLGQTTQDIIMEVRFEKARQLKKANPFESKKNVAMSVGVTNATYFFKKMESRFGREF